MRKPRILYIPWDKPVHHEEAWKLVNEKFDIVTYDFDSVEEYMAELRKPQHGKIGNIDAVFRPTWLKSSPYVHHYILRGDAVRLLPSSVKIVVQSGHGYDIVDVDYLTSRGILFCNSPDSCSRATADIGILLIISSFRYSTYAEHCVRSGNYYDSQELAQIAEDPNGHTLGIIGLGTIGRLVAKSCQSLGMKTIYHNRSRKPEIESDFPEGSLVYYENFKEFLSKADCILVLCAYNQQSRHMINFEAFRYMKPKVRLVNIARGPIVEEAAVIDALGRGQLVGAGFDVHEFEPKISDKLLSNWKVTLLPHLGAVSQTSWRNFEKKCVDNIIEYFYGSGHPNAINSELLEK